MPKKNRNSAGLALPIKLPAIAIIVQDKGGDGKSLLAHVMSERARMAGVATGVVEVDSQGKSLSILGPHVVSIATDAKMMRRDPNVALRSLTPLYETIEATSKLGGLTIVEFGANESSRGALWSAMLDLQEDIDALGAEVLVITPFTTQAESMRRGAKSAQSFLEALPRAHLVLVENQRDGAVADQHPASNSAEAYRNAIMPLAANAITLRMPMIEAGCWRPFEAGGVRLVDAVTMPVEDIMKLTGQPWPEAKINRHVVAGWAGEMFEEIDKLIAFESEQND